MQQKLKEFMEEKRLSLTSISRALGLSTAAISQYLAGIYTGNVAKIDDSVKGFLARQQERARTPKRRLEFMMTSAARKVFEVARICHLDGEIGVCYGEAGLGKTTAVKKYAEQNTDVILLEADLGYTARVVFTELHKRLGMDGRGTIHDMFDEVVAKLRDSGRLIIIDEAEHLPYRALELLRRVYDKAGVGIMLCGMPRLISNLRGKKGEYAQLYSRVGVAGRLEALKAQDVEALVAMAIPASNGLWKAYHEAACGNTRTLCKLLLRSVRVAEINNMPVSPEVVRETARMLII